MTEKYQTSTGTNKMRKTNALYLEIDSSDTERHTDTQRYTQRHIQRNTERHTHRHTERNTKAHRHTYIVPTQFI